MSTFKMSMDDTASKITGQVSELGRDAAEFIDQARNETADGLHAAASSIRKNVRDGTRAAENFANGTAPSLDEASAYLKQHDLKRTLAASRQAFRRYPAESLAIAAGIGILTGIALHRFTHICSKS